MSIVKHKYLNNTSKSRVYKAKNKSIKPINKTIKNSDKNLDDIIYKRYIFIAFILIISFIFISIRLFYLQIVEHDKYVDSLVVATEKTVLGSSAPRGRIYDRNYKLLVDNKAIKTIYYKKENNVKSKDEVALAYKLSDMIDVDYKKLSDYRLKVFYYVNNYKECRKKITDSEWDQYKKRKINDTEIDNLIYERITEDELSVYKERDLEAAYIYYLMNRGYSYAEKTIKNKNVTEEEYARISENVDSLHGVNTKLDWERIYLYGDTFKSILGTVSSDTQGIPKELTQDYLAKGYSLDDRVGISYLEYQYEDYLKGTKAIYKVINNNELELVSYGKRGNDIVLTIDIELQKILEDTLRQEVLRAKNEPNTKSLPREPSSITL